MNREAAISRQSKICNYGGFEHEAIRRHYRAVPLICYLDSTVLFSLAVTWFLGSRDTLVFYPITATFLENEHHRSLDLSVSWTS